jgi:hypothetical protein
MNAQVNRRVGGVARHVPTPPTCRFGGVAPQTGGDTSDTSTHPTPPPRGGVAGNPGEPGTHQRDTAGATEHPAAARQPRAVRRLGAAARPQMPWVACGVGCANRDPAGRPVHLRCAARADHDPGALAADHSPKPNPGHGPFCGPWTPQNVLGQQNTRSTLNGPRRPATGPQRPRRPRWARQHRSGHRDPAGW